MGEYTRPLSLHRWMYVDGNPVNYIDPSGHCYLDDLNDICIPPNPNYGISFGGNWTEPAKGAVYAAVEAVGIKLSTMPALQGRSPASAFRLVYRNGVYFSWNTSCSNCRPNWCQNNDKWEDPVYGVDKDGKRILIDDKGNAKDANGNPYYCKPVGGVTINSGKIEFASLYPDHEKARNNVVHELGHVFNALAGGQPVAALRAAYVKTLGLECYFRENWPKRTNPDYGPYYGFASPKDQRIWQMHYSIDSDIYTEEFADMFLGWVFNRWEVNDVNDAGTTRSEWMNEYMPGWVEMIVNR